MPTRRGTTLVVVRVLLALLVLQALVVAVPALVAPRWFYETFPFGTGWLQRMGPYAEHFVVDTGSVFLGSAVVTVLALLGPTPDRVRLAAAGNVVAAVPHAIYHSLGWRMVGALPTVVVAGTLWITAAIGLVLLLVARRLGDRAPATG